MVSFYGEGFYVSSENQRSTYAGLIVLFTFSCRISKDNPLNYNCASKKCTTFLPSAFFKNKTNTKNTYNMHFDLFVPITSSRVKSVNVIYFILFFSCEWVSTRNYIFCDSGLRRINTFRRMWVVEIWDFICDPAAWETLSFQTIHASRDAVI